ncbi:hypothetical protein R5R35_014683 [Gryllus longicercus]|uniref:Uncharacterized protein n=1 Tax=Gryllus longicercus TaxID=2509291 RepID=A0AAN9V8B9_9ORTH
MGARQSKRSVDITTSPKKGEIDGSQPVDGRLEKIEDGDKTAANGSTRAAEQDAQVSHERRLRHTLQCPGRRWAAASGTGAVFEPFRYRTTCSL